MAQRPQVGWFLRTPICRRMDLCAWHQEMDPVTTLPGAMSDPHLSWAVGHCYYDWVGLNVQGMKVGHCYYGWVGLNVQGMKVVHGAFPK